MQQTALWLVFGLGLAMIAGCFVPKRLLPQKMPHDGLLHIAAFGLLALPVGMGVEDTSKLLWMCGGLFVFGIVVEIFQMWVPDRHFGWDDVAYNGVGIVAGGLLGFGLQVLMAPDSGMGPLFEKAVAAATRRSRELAS